MSAFNIILISGEVHMFGRNVLLACTAGRQTSTLLVVSLSHRAHGLFLGSPANHIARTARVFSGADEPRIQGVTKSF